MLLIGAPLSPFVRKSRIVAAEKNIDYDFDPKAGPMGWPEDYQRINPLMRIPSLLPDAENKDFAINDSSAICAYFEKLQPEPPLYPNDAVAYGRALWIEELADSEMAAKIGMGVFRPVIFNLFAEKAADIEAAKKGFAALEEVLLPYLEAQLGGAEWFAGDMYSIADIAVFGQLHNLNLVGFGLPADKYPNLKAHFERCSERQTIAAFIEDDTKFFAKMGLEIERVID